MYYLESLGSFVSIESYQCWPLKVQLCYTNDCIVQETSYIKKKDLFTMRTSSHHNDNKFTIYISAKKIT